MAGARDCIVRNWHIVSQNLTQNVSTLRVKTNETTGESTGTVSMLSTLEVVVEAWLIPPLDPYDTTDPTGTVLDAWVNPAANPDATPTSVIPLHGCYVDLSNRFYVRTLGGAYYWRDRPAGISQTPWRLKKAAHFAGYANEIIPVLRWQAVFSATGTKTQANVRWTGTLNPDRFAHLW